MEQSYEHIITQKSGPAKPVFLQQHNLVFDEMHKCVISEWHGFVNKQSLMEGARHSLNLLKKHNCPNLLVDHRRVHGTWADMGDWQQYIWLPNALQAGLKKYALVANSGSYSALVMELSFEKLSSEIEIMLFSDLEEAKSWLAGF